MLRPLLTAVLLLLVPLTAEARPEQHAKKTAASKQKPKKKTKASRFDPADYLKKKEQHTQTGVPDPAGKPGDALSLKRQGVVCAPPKKVPESCFGANCKEQVVAEQQVQGDPAALVTDPTDTTRITNDLMKTIKENCAQEISAEPTVKPVFEIGVRENPAAGTQQNKEVVPKLGIQASF